MISKAYCSYKTSKFSSLVPYFLKAAQANQLSVILICKRKREVELVVPAKYTAVKICKPMATTLAENYEV